MIARSIVGRRKAKLSVLMAAAMVALTGCGALHPGAAAVVGDETIAREDVDALAEALCSAEIVNAKAQGEPADQLMSRAQRERALGFLLQTELSQQFGEAEGIEANRNQVSQVLAQAEQAIGTVPEDRRDDYRTALQEYVEGQYILVEAGRQSLGENTPEDQAVAEGYRLRTDFAKDLDIEIDPRFGTLKEDTVKHGGTELSVAASGTARAGARAKPAPVWVSQLPASQKCS